MTHNFKAGDTVTCTEHSHPMTVAFATDDRVHCTWFAGNTGNAADYRPEDLTLSDEQPMPDLNLGGKE